MNIFDIVGPIMIGPSSSHTAGATKIGRVVRTLLGSEPTNAIVKFHGSFAQTYKGHGTDKAIIAGLMNMLPDDERIRDSLELARKANINFTFEEITLEDAHPNTVVIVATNKDGASVTVKGESVGGGNILITKIDELDVKFTGNYNTLIINHNDAPGAIAVVSHLLSQSGINIASMNVYRSYRGGDAIMIIEMDQAVDKSLNTLISGLPGITHSTLLKSI